MTEEEMRTLFREMREEPIPADSLARVRLGVEQGIGKKSWWKFAALMAVAACVVAGFLLLRPVKAPVAVEQPSAPAIAEVLSPPELPIQPARIAPRPKRVRPRPQRVEVLPVSIRIETPDPDVVILFVN
jgi:hypothetical protein